METTKIFKNEEFEESISIIYTDKNGKKGQVYSRGKADFYVSTPSNGNTFKTLNQAKKYMTELGFKPSK